MRKTPMPPRTARLKSKTPVKRRNAKRRAKELERCYGTPERRAWMKAKPCCWCGLWGHTEQAHTENGGKSRKAGAETIAPLCGELGNGCHAAYDRHRAPFDIPAAREAVKSYVATLDAEWRVHVGQVHGTPTQRTA